MITPEVAAIAALKISAVTGGEMSDEERRNGAFFVKLGVDPMIVSMIRDGHGEEAAVGYVMGAYAAQLANDEDPLADVEVDLSLLQVPQAPDGGGMGGMLGILRDEGEI